ncbi:hypothetical protein P280DRAFT_544457 [Massarina eburnea CBS 473.64]|uniref:BRCT domain-containing protein n=1 Tax=Massarina eburnea CBS 473.64 TaxID=1395130 RepID=A0A6A6SE26_9PLEO|nr:hypothetical protein P280DRAFT_544457 [Massarina eburnea CBS 473.64]
MGHGPDGNSQMPLQGAILCCTAIPPEQRTELGNMSANMGATVKLDLTSDVTHLVVGSINSAKYRYVAKSREDVKVLHVEWLKALREVWMQGGEVDVATLENQYRLPTFYGLKVCLTGFEHPAQRKRIQDIVSENGGEYHGDLTKAVTHLIAASPTGKKYEHAVAWQIKVVAWEWFEQSVARGMALDEEYFNPTIPVEQRGQGAWDRRQHSPAPGKRVREIAQSDFVNPLRRKLRRSASSKLGTQSDALWAGIMEGSFEQKRNDEDDWTDTSIISKPELPAGSDPFTPTAEVTPDAEPTEDSSRPRRPFLDDEDGIFAGRVVFPHGFDRAKTNILCGHLDGNGAVVIRDATEVQNFSPEDLRRGYVVVPHDVPFDAAALPEGAGNLLPVTNWWVERCLYGKDIVDPTDCVLCRPFDKLSISGFNGLTINLTGFTGIELLQVTKAVTLFGATNDGFLSPKISVMICNTHNPNPEKFKYANDKRIPAVHASWLWACIRTGRMQPYGDHLLNTTLPEPRNPKQRAQAPLPEVPTVPLSEENDPNLRKKIQSAKLAAKQRGGLKRTGTLELTLSAPPTPGSSSAHTNQSSIEHDAQLPLMYDGTTSFPLQDINPNSPRHASSSSPHNSNIKPTTEAPPRTAPRRRNNDYSPDSVIPPDTIDTSLPPPSATDELPPKPPEPDYSAVMSALLANRKTTTTAQEGDAGGPARRKRKPLGRAQSMRSNASTASASASVNSSVKPQDDTAVTEERDEGDGKEGEIPQPSQELGWDSPGAQRARKEIIKAVGGKVEEIGGGGVENRGGVVKDVIRDEGIGRSVGRRRRGL